jgi:hypothetical protein
MNNAIALDLSRCSTEVSGGHEINSLLGRLAMKVGITGRSCNVGIAKPSV